MLILNPRPLSKYGKTLILGRGNVRIQQNFTTVGSSVDRFSIQYDTSHYLTVANLASLQQKREDNHFYRVLAKNRSVQYFVHVTEILPYAGIGLLSYS